jgi:hypothetical protein
MVDDCLDLEKFGLWKWGVAHITFKSLIWDKDSIRTDRLKHTTAAADGHCDRRFLGYE